MIKLTTLNLYGRFDWHARQANIVDYLRREDSDIIFFQEVVYLPQESPTSQPTEINRQLTYPYEQTVITRLQTSPLYENYREGLSVLSKFPITKSESIVLKQDPRDHLQRIVQLFDISYHGQIVKFANVHFAELPEMAINHLKELLDILSSRDEHRIIVGDFNIPDLENHQDIWEGDYRASITESYISFPSMKTRIDYILMPKSDLFVQLSWSPDNLSDHRAVTAEIKLPT